MAWNQRFDAGDPHRYDDMLRLAHHVSSRHPQMSRENRAAQFSPFAALTGYDEEVAEAGRMTERKIELSEGEKARLDERLHMIQTWISHMPGKWDFLNADAAVKEDSAPASPEVIVSHFVADARKAGGEYIVTRGSVKKIDLYGRFILMMSGETIQMDDILSIEGEAF